MIDGLEFYVPFSRIVYSFFLFFSEFEKISLNGLYGRQHGASHVIEV